MNAASRIKAIINAINRKTGLVFYDLTSAIQELCVGYKNATTHSSVVSNGMYQSGCRLSELLLAINNITGINHTNLTNGVQT